jgi:hypothetical protein
MSTPRSAPRSAPRTDSGAETTSVRSRLARLATPRRLAAGVMAGALTLAVPGVAGALPVTRSTLVSPTATISPTRVTTVIQRCDAAITQRFGQITTLDAQMVAAKALTPAHQAALTSELATSRAGLAGLETQINAATTLTQLLTLCPQIVNNFRIYVLETPKVHLTMGSDRETSVVARLQAVGPKLEAAITAAQGKGQNVGNAPALYADFSANVGSAGTLARGVPGEVMTLTPAQYDAGSAKPVLVSAADAVSQAKDDLVNAHNDATQIVAILQGLVGSATPTTATPTTAAPTTTAT